MTSKAIAKGSDMMGNHNEKLIDEKDEVAFDDRMVSIFRGKESNGGDPDIIFQGKDERSAGNES
ncbi:hypothetical protein [Peribacillus frigoritolerans]|uniref:hypothetical protein n=1 Tax=Peribacillus frigoritolerans TaxID=450367 RepID=UPI00207A4275|nr:hypothetical protein [Peribacillus frigoritolerans]USK75971.1 hypothetical protein LIT31_05220 [Peribacillus frigoritolerans]